MAAASHQMAARHGMPDWTTSRLASQNTSQAHCRLVIAECEGVTEAVGALQGLSDSMSSAQESVRHSRHVPV